jgi:hypothetical protein
MAQPNLMATVCGALALVLVLVNVVFSVGLKTKRAEVQQRQLAIARGAQLAQVNNALIQTLVLAAVNRNDPQIGALLQQNGVTYQLNAQPVGVQP